MNYAPKGPFTLWLEQDVEGWDWTDFDHYESAKKAGLEHETYHREEKLNLPCWVIQSHIIAGSPS